MAIFDFFKREKVCLGIDIGTAILKIVELSKEKERFKLKNYGLARPDLAKLEHSKTTDLSAEELAQLIKQILKEAKIQNRKAVISLPILNTFSTLIELPFMPEKELAAAIPFEARKFIPVPIEEVVLDWSVIPQFNQPGKADTTEKVMSDVKKEEKKIMVLVVAVPKEIIDKYVQIAKMADLKLLSLEQEAFSLARSLVGNDLETYLLVDIGSQASSVIIIDNGFVRFSHSLESIDRQKICQEIEKFVNLYKIRYNKDIKTCILSGGVKNSDLTDFLRSCLAIETIIGNPFARVEYPPALEPVLKEIGPLLSVAVGLAMRQ